MRQVSLEINQVCRDFLTVEEEGERLVNQNEVTSVDSEVAVWLAVWLAG